MLFINLMLFGVIGLSVWAVQMVWIPIFAAGIINGTGHWNGYRNFETMDSSTNIVPWGILIEGGGEELHNNHYAFASSARFSAKRWALDIGWLYISLLAMVGLARVKKLASSPQMDREKTALDLDTLTALVGSRFHVMADYAKHVLKTVHREELEKAETGIRRQLKATGSLLGRDRSLMNDKQRLLLRDGLKHSSALTVVCDFRKQLQQIFTERTASPERLLAQLQEWCGRAEATGIAALGDFAASLQCYTLSAAQQS